MDNLDNGVYQIFEKKIEDFENGKLELGRFISAVDSLISLESLDEQWSDTFRSEWWTLEQVYSVSLDRGKTTLTTEYIVLIDEAIRNMKSLLSRTAR
jgi:hypothetical protein